MKNNNKLRPGAVRDAIFQVFASSESALSVGEIVAGVQEQIADTPPSSIRSYLRLNTPELFIREDRGVYKRKQQHTTSARQQSFAKSNEDVPQFTYGNSTLINDDCFSWMERQKPNSIHAVVTDPPYGLHEYSEEQQQKLRARKGGVWRIPPSFDGHTRAPLPRFTTLDADQLDEIARFFGTWARLVRRIAVPGANVIVASNPLVSHIVSVALSGAGLERRGELIRLTMTMRGGDRPKGAHHEFNDVSVMPRSMWEPWLLFRKPIEGRVQDNLRNWKTGGFRRIACDKPFGDVIQSSPTRKKEKEIAPHPSLKPQAFVRKVVRAILPLGEGIILDPFAGAGSTLAACSALKYEGIGVEKDNEYFNMAKAAIPQLAALKIDN
jgi:site-specific DNA-methyltransferase (adenine-specific)|tara:strand:+ start:440 stop:1582 length:1143 start_codon:yes stop_codon:yes gene_type:complete